MNDTAWKQQIYEPFLETWKILKLIQHADQSANNDELWQRYMKEIDRLNEQYPNNKFVQDLLQLLIDAGDSIAKMNSEVTT